MKTVTCDYLIVGQGLAGTTLAMELLFRGKSVKVIDQPSLNRCSVVAAGLFNPVTGRLPALTWRAEEVFEELEKFYPQVENETGERFFYPRPVYRPFASEQEQAHWLTKSSDEEMQSFVKHIYTRPSGEVGVRDPLGGLLLRRCGFVDVPIFLKSVRSFLRKDESFVDAGFEFQKLLWNGSYWDYDHFRASKVVLCQGVKASGSIIPLPVRPLKGETLTIVSSQVPRWIYNRGVYVVPVPGTANFKVGATYSRNDSTERITSESRRELEERAELLLSSSWEVVGQEWGMRPTSPDRRPMVGSLPGFRNLFVINGLGTKGVSLAPYVTKRLADHMINDAPLDNLIALSRYY